MGITRHVPFVPNIVRMTSVPHLPPIPTGHRPVGPTRKTSRGPHSPSRRHDPSDEPLSGKENSRMKIHLPWIRVTAAAVRRTLWRASVCTRPPRSTCPIGQSRSNRPHRRRRAATAGPSDSTKSLRCDSIHRLPARRRRADRGLRATAAHPGLRFADRAQYTQPTAAYPQYPQTAASTQQYPANYTGYARTPYVAQQPTPETMPAAEEHVGHSVFEHHDADARRQHVGQRIT